MASGPCLRDVIVVCAVVSAAVALNVIAVVEWGELEVMQKYAALECPTHD